jgi:hypothetical protein
MLATLSAFPFSLLPVRHFQAIPCDTLGDGGPCDRNETILDLSVTPYPMTSNARHLNYTDPLRFRNKLHCPSCRISVRGETRSQMSSGNMKGRRQIRFDVRIRPPPPRTVELTIKHRPALRRRLEAV